MPMPNGNKRPTVHEDAAELLLGPDFQRSECLSLSEVALLLEGVKNNSATEEDELSQTLQAMYEYAQQFSQYKTKDAIIEMKKILSRYDLESFEVAQLASLSLETPDEVYELIPSLQRRIDRDELEILLADLERLRRFQS